MEKSNDKNINISPVPKFVDTALVNIADAPTKQMGSTFADIWFLVFGGIGQVADKRRMKYATALDSYSKELNNKISAIPESNRIDADIQIVAPALEASKYCIEKEELREMFVNLIVSSMNNEKESVLHPIFTDIVKKLSPLDAKILNIISFEDSNDDGTEEFLGKIELKELAFSIAVIQNLGLVQFKDFETNSDEVSLLDKKHKILNLLPEIDLYFENVQDNFTLNFVLNVVEKIIYDSGMGKNTRNSDDLKKMLGLTPLGERFKTICLGG